MSKWPNHASGLLTAIALLLPYLNATASLPTTRSNPRMSNVECSMLNVGRGTSYTYTPDGKLASRTWARGITTTYSYDTAHNLTSISYWRSSVSAIPDPDTPTVYFTHDHLGRQISAIVNGVSTNLYSYDALTQALTVETQNGVIITRATDALGRNIGF